MVTEFLGGSSPNAVREETGRAEASRRWRHALLAATVAVAALGLAQNALAAPQKARAGARPAKAAACTAISFGTPPTAASISAAGEIDCYTFTGANQDRIRIRVIETGGTLIAQHQVKRPNGSVVCANTTAQETTCVLDTAGTHQIEVSDNTGTKTGNYSIQIQRLNAPLGCTGLNFGASPTQGNITAAAQQDCFTFSGNVGDQIRVRVAETSGSLFAIQEMVRPDGTTLPCGPTSALDTTCALTSTGTHTVLVDDNNGTNTGQYVIAIQRLNNPTGCPAINFGAAPTTASIGTAGELDCYGFTGSAGDRIRIRVVETTGSPPFFALQEVVRPNGTTDCFVTSAQDVTCLLDTTGPHRIIVADNNGANTGNYSIAIQRLNSPPNASCPAITLGAAPTAAGIAAAGELDCFRFNGTAGDRIRVRVAETSGALLAMQEMVRPNGTTVTACSPTTALDMTCTLNVTGPYRIIVYDTNGTNTGNYVIAARQLNTTAGCTALTFGAVPTAAGIGTAGELDCYSFSGASGDRIRVRVVESSGSPPFFAIQEVVRTDGTTICFPTTAQDVSCDLDSTGTHTIVVSDNSGTNTGNYSIAIQRLNNPPGASCPAIAFGAAPTTAGIAAVAEMDCYRFTGAPGDRIRVRVAETSGALLAIQEMVRPDGTTLPCSPTGATDMTCTLEGAGEHRVIVYDNAATNTGNYSIAIQRLNNPPLASCPAIAFGAAPTAASIGVAGELDCYGLTGKAGDRIRIRLVETSGSPPFFATQELVGPDGSTACSATTAQDVTCVVGTKGPQRIIVADNNGANTGNYSIAIQRLNNPPAASCPAITLGAAPTAAGIAVAAELDCFSFSGTAGDRIRVRVAETSGALVATQEMVRPNGTTVAACSPTAALDMTCALNATGTYRIIVYDNNGANTGNYVIAAQSLTNPAGCTPLTLGDPPTAASIGNPGELDCFSFSGSAADRIRIRVVETTASPPFFATQEVVQANGTTECGATAAQDVNCDLNTGGTHRIIVADSSGTATGNYSIEIQRLSNPPAASCPAISFGAAPSSGTITAAADLDCVSFAGAAGDVVHVRTVETSGTLTAVQEMVRPDGTTVPCSPTTAADMECTLDDTGTFAVVVYDNNGQNTGTFVIAAQRLNNPVGCTALTFGSPPTAGSIGNVGELDCYTFAATAGDDMTLTVNETSPPPFFTVQEILRPNGTVNCGPTTGSPFNCTTDTDGTYTILVADSAGPNTGNYNISIAT